MRLLYILIVFVFGCSNKYNNPYNLDVSNGLSNGYEDRLSEMEESYKIQAQKVLNAEEE